MKKIFILPFIIIALLSACTKEHGHLYRIQVDGKFGFIDSLGNEVIKPQYKYVSPFFNDRIAYVISDMKLEDDLSLVITYGYINKQNKIIIDTINKLRIDSKDEIWHISLVDMANKFHNEKIGFRDQYLEILHFSMDRFIFQDESTKLFGFKNSKGDIVIEAKYRTAHAFCNGVSIVTLPQKDSEDQFNVTGAIDTNGNTIIPHEYFQIWEFLQNGKTWASTVSFSVEHGIQKDWVQIDKSGEITIGPISGFGLDCQIYNAMDDIYVMTIPFNTWGLGVTYYTFVDNQGRYLTDKDNDMELSLGWDENSECEMESNVTLFNEGFAGVRRFDSTGRKAWLFANEKLELVSEPYDSLLAFREGLAAVKEIVNGNLGWGKWGFVNKKFDMKIPYSFDEVDSFSHGLAWFVKSGNAFDVVGYINKSGEIVWQTKKTKTNAN